MSNILAEFGFDQLDVQEIKEFFEEVEEVLEDPQQSIEEFFGFEIEDVIDDVIEFELDNFTIPIQIEQYLPLLDITGPYLFYPEHCFNNNDKGQYDSQVIAYIETGSQVEKHVIQQLEALFATQRDLVENLDELS